VLEIAEREANVAYVESAHISGSRACVAGA
jgi:hypothetical protein